MGEIRELNIKKEFVEPTGDDLTEIQNSFMAEFKADPRMVAKIKELGLESRKDVRANLASLIDYHEDLKICDACPGALKCPKKDTMFHQMDLLREEGEIKRIFKTCEKGEDFLVRSSPYLIQDFPDSWLFKGVKDVERSYNRKNLMLALVKTFKEEGEWAYIYGEEGLGKSFAIAAFCNSIAENERKKGNSDFSIIYAKSKKLYKRLSNVRFKVKEDFDDLLFDIENASILVLDDFGNEEMNKTIIKEALIDMLQYRADNNLWTIFTSTLSLEEFEAKLAWKIPSIEARKLVKLIKNKTKGETKLSGIKGLYQ